MIELLENNEVILLMFLADELPAEDRAEVTQMLASDAGLRRELEQLSRAYEESSDGLRRLDEANPIHAGAQAVGVRHVMHAIRQRLDKPAPVPGRVRETRKLHYPWWAYPAAAAAAIFLAFLTWWGNHEGSAGLYDDGPARLPFVRNHDGRDDGVYALMPNDPNAKLAEELENTFKTHNDPDSALLALRDAPRMADLGSDSDE